MVRSKAGFTQTSGSSSAMGSLIVNDRSVAITARLCMSAVPSPCPATAGRADLEQHQQRALAQRLGPGAVDRGAVRRHLGGAGGEREAGEPEHLRALQPGPSRGRARHGAGPSPRADPRRGPTADIASAPVSGSPSTPTRPASSPQRSQRDGQVPVREHRQAALVGVHHAHRGQVDQQDADDHLAAHREVTEPCRRRPRGRPRPRPSGPASRTSEFLTLHPAAHR